MPKIPSYRKRKDRDQALVTLMDAVTKRRRDYWLGEYGTASSREEYHRLIAAWEASGRRLPDLQPALGEMGNGTSLSVKQLILAYWNWAKGYYTPQHAAPLKVTLRLLRQLFGSTPAVAFGPAKLRLLREAMIKGDPNAVPPRRPWSRKSINKRIGQVRHVFKWAAGQELIPAAIYQALGAVEPLRRGRSAAIETEKVLPVPEESVERILPLLSEPVRAIVQLQLLTGARPGEILSLRPADIEMNDEGGIWIYRPETHKNAYREKERVIYLGPRAQDLVRPFLCNRATTAFIFSPVESEAARREVQHANRKTPLSCGNRPGTNRRNAPRRQPGDHYTTASYRRAIEYACDRAFPPPEHLARKPRETKAAWLARLGAGNLLDELRDWRRSHRWHPHQLRHNAATRLRREFGLEAAQLALGHASAHITDAVYAERDLAKVMEIMRRIG